MSSIQVRELKFYSTSNQKLVLKFDTGNHAIDAKIVSEVLGALNTCISSATSVVRSCENSRLQVVAITKGSVEVALALSVDGVADNSDNVNTVVNAIVETCDIYKFLDGQPIECVGSNVLGGEDFQITNFDGDVRKFSREAYMTFVGSSVPPLGELDNIEHSDLRSIELLDAGRKTILSIASKDFHCMSRSVVRISNEEPSEKIESCTVKALVIPIGKPRNVWSFEKDGEPFTANILDNGFIEKIERNLVSFNQGARFKVKLKTVYSIDSVTLQKKVVRRQILSVDDVLECETIVQDQLI